MQIISDVMPLKLQLFLSLSSINKGNLLYCIEVSTEGLQQHECVTVLELSLEVVRLRPPKPHPIIMVTQKNVS